MLKPHNAHLVSFGSLVEWKSQGERARIETWNRSSRKEVGARKKDGSLQILLLLFGQVLEQTLPKADIKEESASVSTIDDVPLGIGTIYRVHVELEILGHIR